MTDSEKKSGSPSTLEKAAAKGSEDRDTGSQTDAPQDAATASGHAVDDESAETRADAPRRSFGRQVFGFLAVLLLLAVAYIAWPAWGPALPGWLQAYLAPVMEYGRAAKPGPQVAQFEARIDPLEQDIARLKAAFDARPVSDPARLLALDDLVKQHGGQLAALKTEIDSLSKGPSKGDSGEEIAALTERLNTMETRLAALAARPAGPTAADASATQEALDALRARSNERMATLERENVALRDIVAALDRRVGAIEQKSDAGSATGRGNALVLAVGQLRDAAQGTAPFATALQTVETLAASEPAMAGPLAALKPHASAGVPDLIALRLHFNQIAGRIAHESFVPKGDGWIDRTVAQVSRLFTFRRTGLDAASGTDENARVAQAELRLAAGDLDGAVSVVEGLQEPGLSYAGPWLKKARARLAVDAAVKTLFAEALARAQPSGDEKGTPRG